MNLRTISTFALSISITVAASGITQANDKCEAIQNEIYSHATEKHFPYYDELPKELQEKIDANSNCLFVGGNKRINMIPQVGSSKTPPKNKIDIAKQKAERQNNKQMCKDLAKRYKADLDKIPKNMEFKAMMDLRRKIGKKYVAVQNTIPGCNGNLLSHQY